MFFFVIHSFLRYTISEQLREGKGNTENQKVKKILVESFINAFFNNNITRRLKLIAHAVAT